MIPSLFAFMLNNTVTEDNICQLHVYFIPYLIMNFVDETCCINYRSRQVSTAYQNVSCCSNSYYLKQETVTTLPFIHLFFSQYSITRHPCPAYNYVIDNCTLHLLLQRVRRYIITDAMFVGEISTMLKSFAPIIDQNIVQMHILLLEFLKPIEFFRNSRIKQTPSKWRS